MDDYLSKPLEAKAVLDKIEAWAAFDSLATVSSGGKMEPERDKETPFDVEKALKQLGIDREFLNELMRDFKMDLNSKFDQLNDVLPTGDFERIASLAHNIKGAAATLCADETFKLAKALEIQARNSEFLKCQQLVEQIGQQKVLIDDFLDRQV